MRTSIFYWSVFLFALYIGAVSAAASDVASTNPSHVEPKSAQNHMDAGSEYFHNGSFISGLNEWSQALELFQEAGNKVGESRALLHKGSAYLALGRYQDAVANLRLALEYASELNASARYRYYRQPC